MKHSNKLAFIAIAALSMVFSACKYEEGPGISFISKRDRLANEWKITGYEVDGSEDVAMKNSFRYGDSIELIFTMTRNYNYSSNMAYVDGYTSPSGDKLLSPSATDTRVYQDILAAFKGSNVLYTKLWQGGRYTFADKYRQVHFGVNGNNDLAHVEGNDSSLVKSDIIMLKNKMLKLEFTFDGKKHRITFEPKNKEIIK